MPVKRYKKSDKRFVSDSDAPTLYTFKSVTTGDEYSSFDKTPTSPDYKILETTQSSRVADIMNRKLVRTQEDIEREEHERKGRKFSNMWDEGLIQHPLLAHVKEAEGKRRITFVSRKSKRAWLDKVVEIKVNGKTIGYFNMGDIAYAFTKIM